MSWNERPSLYKMFKNQGATGILLCRLNESYNHRCPHSLLMGLRCSPAEATTDLYHNSDYMHIKLKQQASVCLRFPWELVWVLGEQILCQAKFQTSSALISFFEYIRLVLKIIDYWTIVLGTGKTQRNRVVREVGGGIRMGNTCKSMADSCPCMTKTTTLL